MDGAIRIRFGMYVHVRRLTSSAVVAVYLSGTALAATEPPHNAVTAWNAVAAAMGK